MSSFREPPGWIIDTIFAAPAASTASGNGKNASDARAAPATLLPA